jgi:DNA-binding NarL/FixJ family response regulator
LIRVAIADDHQLFAEGLADALNALPDMRVVSVVGNGMQLLEGLKTQPADVVLLDLEMPGLDGLGTLDKIHRPDRVLVVSMHVSPESVEAVARLGAAGFFSKSANLIQLAAAIRAINAGEKLIELSADDVKIILDRYSRPELDSGAASLTDREVEILQLLAKGVSSTEDLAQQLYISQKTVKNHLASIFGKLAVSDRTQAAIEAIRLGLARPK